ncbi:AzlC family ABC transporter permease [Bacillus smithii]|uniref:AzlC family ABC transporter permease n=1 Tax=Bacillus smithii TaxID=1479 RepID=UPI002E1EA241|nr:AzlC family ABC transporter permease [Bacillus smithii]MED1454880.1 AzlC family ABC transporter permease [Bacillus smithii]
MAENARINTYSYPYSEEGFWQGAKDCVPTLLGYWSIGFAAGVVEKTAGLTIAEIVLISLILYAGSGQFIASGMIAATNPVSAIIFTIFFINLRHLLMSAAISPYFRHLPLWKNVLTGSLLTDETFGVAMNHLSNRAAGSFKWMLGLNVTAYVNWLIGNVAGGFFGEWIPDPNAFGLDFALPAMFIGLLVLQITSRKKWMVDLAVAICSASTIVILSFFVSGSTGVITAAIVAATAGVFIEKWK